MWNDITNENDLLSFLELTHFFHDSCIKELQYISGAYVDEDLSMYPLNDQRRLRVVLQQQDEEHSMIELEFNGLKYLKLFPLDDQYTCEILDATLIIKNNCVYWADCGGIAIEDIENYDGTIICAAKLRWRSINGFLGNEEFFVAPI